MYLMLSLGIVLVNLIPNWKVLLTMYTHKHAGDTIHITADVQYTQPQPPAKKHTIFLDAGK